MKTSFKSIRNIGLKYGFAGGIITVMFLMLISYLGRSILDPALTIVMAFVILLFIGFAFVEHRQIDQNTRFWKNMSIGIIIYLFIEVFSSVFVFITVKWMDSDLIPQFVDDRVKMMRENKQAFVERFDEETFNEALEGVKNTQPYHLAIDRFIRDATSGLFVTILISAIFHFLYNRKVFTNQKSE